MECPVLTDAFFLIRCFKRRMIWECNRVYSLNTDVQLKPYAEDIAKLGFFFVGCKDEYRVLACAECELHVSVKPDSPQFTPSAIEVEHKAKKGTVCEFLTNKNTL